MMPMTRLRVLLAATLCCVGFASTTSAQTPQPVAVFGVGGVVYQAIAHSEADPGAFNTLGPTIGFQFRTARSGSIGYVFELMADPVPARDRHKLFDDSFAPFYGMAGIEIGRRRYIRLSAGATTMDEIAPIAGIAIGFESGGSQTGLLTGAEFIVRAGGRKDAVGVFAGIQLRVGGFAGQ